MKLAGEATTPELHRASSNGTRAADLVDVAACARHSVSWLSEDRGEDLHVNPSRFPQITGSAGLSGRWAPIGDSGQLPIGNCHSCDRCACCEQVAALLHQHQQDLLAHLRRQEVLLQDLAREGAGAEADLSALAPPRLAPRGGLQSTRMGTTSITKSITKSRFPNIHEEERHRMTTLIDPRRASALMTEFSSDRPKWSLSQSFQRLVSHRYFDVAVVFTIVVSGVVLGVDVQLEAERPSEKPHISLEVINLGCSAFFFFEIGVRMFAHGRSFCTSKERWWNLVDTTLVLCSISDVFAFLDVLGFWDSMESLNESTLSNYRVMRTLRFARIVRLARVNRVLRFVTPLRVLVSSILSTIWHLICALQLFLLTVFFFSVYFTRSAVDLLQAKYADGDMDAVDQIKKYWKDLPGSMFTLFKCMSSGVNWGDAIEPLSVGSPELVWVFMIFIAFAQLALLNVVTGVFCQVAIDNAQRQKDLKVRSIVQNKERMAEAIRELFSGLDTDANGHITFRELKKTCKGHAIHTFMATLDLEPADLWQLFTLLDTDGSNGIDADEFAEGCMRLRGTAKALDLATLQREHERLGMKMVDFMKYMERRMDYLTDYWSSEIDGEVQASSILGRNSDSRMSHRMSHKSSVRAWNTPDPWPRISRTSISGISDARLSKVSSTEAA